MSQLDNSIAALAHGASLWAVLALAFLLGLRHAADPDHLAAVSSLVATDGRDGPRVARRLGFAWGLGHGLTLLTFGLPVIFVRSYLPDVVQRGAEMLVGLVVALLAVRLMKQWREGRLHLHEHEHGGVRHAHLHSHAAGGRDHAHPHGQRTPRGAFAVGLLHGFGGSAGAAVLTLAAVQSRLAAVALVLLAVGAAVSMVLLSTGFGLALVRFPARASLHRTAPALALSSLGFGLFYSLAALSLIPSSF